MGGKGSKPKGTPLTVSENGISYNSLIDDAHVDPDAKESMDLHKYVKDLADKK